MSFYGNLALTATTLLTKFGRPLVLTGPPIRTVNGVQTKIVKHIPLNSGVDIGDVEFMLEPAAEPYQGERIEADDTSLVIMYVEPIKPAGTVLAWFAYGRRG